MNILAPSRGDNGDLCLPFSVGLRQRAGAIPCGRQRHHCGHHDVAEALMNRSSLSDLHLVPGSAWELNASSAGCRWRSCKAGRIAGLDRQWLNLHCDNSSVSGQFHCQRYHVFRVLTLAPSQELRLKDQSQHRPVSEIEVRFSYCKPKFELLCSLSGHRLKLCMAKVATWFRGCQRAAWSSAWRQTAEGKSTYREPDLLSLLL